MTNRPQIKIKVLYKYSINKKFIKMIMTCSWKTGENIVFKSKLTGTKFYLKIGGAI